MKTLLDLYKNDIESIVKIGKKDILPITTLEQFNIVLRILFINAKKSIKIFADNLFSDDLETYKALKSAYENNPKLQSEIYLRYNCFSSRIRDEFLAHGVYIICNISQSFMGENNFIPNMILVDDNFLIIDNGNSSQQIDKKIIVYDDKAISKVKDSFNHIRDIVTNDK